VAYSYLGTFFEGFAHKSIVLMQENHGNRNLPKVTEPATCVIRILSL